MAYNTDLAQRVRGRLADRPGLEEKAMFGGLGFMLRGNMACGVHGEGLIVRVGPERYEETLQAQHTRVFDLTGRPMKGWIVVTPEGWASDEALAGWVEQGVAFALSLPPK
jgi:hypothetical protein